MAPPPSKYVHFTVCLFCLAWPLLLASPIHRTPGVTQNSLREAKGDQTVPKNDQTVPQETAMDTTAYQKVTAHKSSDIVSYQNLRVPRYPCSTSLDCYPKDNINDTIPAKYVNCTDNTCKCNGCFYGLNDSCAIEACHRFRNSSQECVDERKSQKEVFLLSVFLSSLGVANTYIGQNTLGKVQSLSSTHTVYTLSLTHTHTHTHSLTLFLTHSLTHSLPLFLTHSLTHSLPLFLSLSLTHSLSLSLSLSLTLSLSFSLSLSLTHSLTQVVSSWLY